MISKQTDSHEIDLVGVEQPSNPNLRREMVFAIDVAYKLK